MSRQTQLPPRCPIPKKSVSRPSNDLFSLSSCTNSFLQHQIPFPQKSIPDEQPTWLDDLLSDVDTTSHRVVHRRSASDPITLLDGLADSFAGSNPHNSEKDSVGSDSGERLESACIYGPNSPKKREDMIFSQTAIVSALSESVIENPLEYVDESLCIYGISHSDLQGDARFSNNELDAGAKMAKRRSGQHYRVRKMQYIAELERTVDVFQALQSELGVRVASLLQQHVALSLENKQIKQQMARLQKEKMISEGKFQCLKKEAERLKASMTISPTGSFNAYSCSTVAAADMAPRSYFNWKILDMKKLNLN